jgi:hypothetical protein
MQRNAVTAAHKDFETCQSVSTAKVYPIIIHFFSLIYLLKLLTALQQILGRLKRRGHRTYQTINAQIFSANDQAPLRGLIQSGERREGCRSL